MPVNQLLVVVAVTFIATPMAQAQLGWCKPAGCGEYDCAQPCQKVCNAECEWVKDKKKCWKVECKDVCIPPVAVPSFGQIFKSAIGLRRTVGELPTRPVAKDGCTSCGEVCYGNCQPTPHHYKGGRMRTVRKLKSHSEEFERLVVKWEVKTPDYGCTKGCTAEVTGMMPPMPTTASQYIQQPIQYAQQPIQQQAPIYGNSISPRPTSIVPAPALRFEAAPNRPLPPDPAQFPANPGTGSAYQQPAAGGYSSPTRAPWSSGQTQSAQGRANLNR